MSGWSPQLEDKAAAIVANGIRKSNPLELRLKAGHCLIDKIKNEKAYDSYDEWHAVYVENTDAAGYLKMIGLLGRCELQNGI